MYKLHTMKYAAVLVPALALGMPMANATFDSGMEVQSSEQRPTTTPPARPAVSSTSPRAGETARQDFLENLPTRGYHSDSLIGKTVTNRRDNETVGEISNLVLDESGQVVAVIISVGGLMGIGERDVAISWDQIERRVDGDDITLTVDFTEDNLKNAPQYSSERSDRPTAMMGTDRANQRASQGANQRATQGADPRASQGADRRADQTAATTPPARPAATDRTATTDRTASTDRTATTGSAQHGYLETMPARGYHSDSLVGQSVKSRSTNDTIGEVSNLVLDHDGQVVAVIVSVGGFLGMGERDVAISWDQIERTVDGDDITLTVDFTEESLRNAPKYSSGTTRSRR